jgi:cellulose binding protein with CBM2 domain
VRSRTIRIRTRRRLSVRAALAVFGAFAVAAAAVLVTETAASALTVSGTPSPVTGNATHFDGLGQPYGGCGMPQANLETPNFIALNVFNTPGDYSAYTRPVPPSQSSILGMFDNGLNCDRWVKVSIGDYCTGTNDGAQSQPFCRNGSWVADNLNGATLDMIVADSCADSNAWCRDDPYHIDINTPSLNNFVLNGSPVGSALFNKWNNRHVTWQFEPAPNYSGDINIGFLQGAQTWWSAISVSHLPNGIHNIQYQQGGTWQSGKMDGDMGQAYIIAPTTAGGNQFQIKVTDASDQPLNGGRIYSFSLPSSCGSQCSAPYTQVTYTTSSGSTGSPSPSTSASASASSSPSASASPSVSASASPSASPSQSSGSGAKCSLTSAVTGSWGSGYQLSFTVANTGTVQTSSWTASFSFPGGQTVASSWNASVAQAGSTVTAQNVNYNGALSPGANTSFGMVVNGANQAPTAMTCTAH